MLQFHKWSTEEEEEEEGCQSDNPLTVFSRRSHWCYADYKYMSDMFITDGLKRDTIMRSVDWSKLGFAERNGEQSTFWLGSKGAYTVCHYDTYGCNLVAQIHGRKRWMLFPPSQTNSLYPTRIPYEESSVFSQVELIKVYNNELSIFVYQKSYLRTY